MEIHTLKINDVIVVECPCENLPRLKQKELLEEIKEMTKSVFPDNKVLVVPKDYTITIIKQIENGEEPCN